MSPNSHQVLKNGLGWLQCLNRSRQWCHLPGGSYGQFLGCAWPFPRTIIFFRRWSSLNTPAAIFHNSVFYVLRATRVITLAIALGLVLVLQGLPGTYEPRAPISLVWLPCLLLFISIFHSLLLLLLTLLFVIVIISTEPLALCDGCLGWGWVWRAGLMACFGYGRLLGCSCYLDLGSAAPVFGFLAPNLHDSGIQ